MVLVYERPIHVCHQLRNPYGHWLNEGAEIERDATLRSVHSRTGTRDSASQCRKQQTEDLYLHESFFFHHATSRHLNYMSVLVDHRYPLDLSKRSILFTLRKPEAGVRTGGKSER